MTIRGVWQVHDNDTPGAVRELLGALFDKKVIDTLLVPVQGANGSVMPALIRSTNRLDRADPLAPVMPFNSARLVSMLTREPGNNRIGVVLRSCEIRALVELVKFNQARLDNLVVIGVDCIGTYAVPAYGAALKQNSNLGTRVMAAAQTGEVDDLAFRTACLMCERPEPMLSDIKIGYIGVENGKALVVEMRDDIAEQLGVTADSTNGEGRAAVLVKLIAQRTAQRDHAFAEFRQQMHQQGGMASYFANCLECTNCMNACPICYCKECFFRTANAEHSSRELMRSAERGGAIPMPPDALLFQMTRLNHMATSCVGCGMCEAACPHDIPLTAMFRTVGARVQKTFDYEPGRDIHDKPPFMVFQRDELQEIGEMS